MTTTPTASTRTVDRALDLLAAVTEQPRLSPVSYTHLTLPTKA